MKKFLMIIVLMTASSYAALQYELISTQNSAQPWKSANELTLNITNGGSLWVSSFVSNWYNNMDDLGNFAKMTAGNYGAVINGTTQVTGTGETQTVTFTNGTKSVTGTSYFLGDFNAGDQVSFWITSKGGVMGSSIGLVSDKKGMLQSRQINTVDAAGNTRINFGFSNKGSVEMVLTGATYKNAPVGQPLPGAFAALLLGGGVLGSLGYSRRKHA